MTTETLPRERSATRRADLAATIYHCLGIDPHAETRDQTGRPFALSHGNPIAELIGS